MIKSLKENLTYRYWPIVECIIIDNRDRWLAGIDIIVIFKVHGKNDFAEGNFIG